MISTPALMHFITWAAPQTCARVRAPRSCAASEAALSSSKVISRQLRMAWPWAANTLTIFAPRSISLIAAARKSSGPQHFSQGTPSAGSSSVTLGDSARLDGISRGPTTTPESIASASRPSTSWNVPAPTTLV